MAGRSEQWLKQLGYRWLRWVAPPGRRGEAAALSTRDLERIDRILVVRLDDRLGNIVLLTPLLVALKGRFSRARLSLLLARRYWDLHPFIPSVDEFIPFDRAALAHNPLRIRSLLRELKERHFDLVLDASDARTVSFNHLVVTALSGGRFRVGYDRGEAGRFYDIPVPVPKNGCSRHAAEMHLDLLRGIVPIRSHPRPLLKRAKAESGFGEAFRRRVGAEAAKPLILIHPGGRGPKRWPATDFADVARRVASSNDAVVALLWGPADENAAREVLSRSGDIIQPAGICPLPDMISLIRSADVFVSGDCGPMHVAAAVGTPTVAVFLVSDADRYRPLGPMHAVFDARHGRVSADDVARAVRETLQGKKTTDRAGAHGSSLGSHRTDEHLARSSSGENDR